MIKNEITFCYVVGGEPRHFYNLANSIRSLERLDRSFYKNIRILITQFGECPIPDFYNDLRKNNYKIKVVEKDSVSNLGRFTDHIIWKEKYATALLAETEYIVYCDTDTVLIHDNIQSLLEKFGPLVTTQHFWVPTFNQFIHNVNPQNIGKFYKCCDALKIQSNFPIAAGGIFLIDNKSPLPQQAMRTTLDLHDLVYPDSHCEYVHGFTDEVIFSYVLAHIPNYKFANGALNHCIMPQMELIIDNNNLYGKNPFDKDYELVTFGHCDIYRRNPSLAYNGSLQKRIKEAFYL